MKLTVKSSFSHSVRDATGNIISYRNELELSDIELGDLTKEQVAAKVRQTQLYLHNEIHKAIRAAQLQDGIPETLAVHNDVPLK